ncbi:response regulator transcription factor [Halalkalirubrum salinum]|uniref:response regulator transcription factor n=1 Tax=Halalkalirubrum salinum TaxID=2563889 RepID=UPI0010FAF875|nr:HalX domain-containing protein [Halalkalirubrum salinum]
MGDRYILVVEDDESIAGLYKRFLEKSYTVETVHTAADAIDRVQRDDASAIDIVLLDRRLPDGPGSDVLDAINKNGLDCRVGMVTGVEPDFDIVNMGFDLYIVKPVNRNDLREAVETLFIRSEYDALLQDATALASKRALLESEKSRSELTASEEYTDLLEQIEDLDKEFTELTEDLTSEDYRVVFRDLGKAGE